MKRESGFTLLEVLVALTLLAVCGALALSAISGALGNIRKVRGHARLLAHAQTVMETTLLDSSITEPTTLHGDFDDGILWTVVISEDAAAAEGAPAPATGSQAPLNPGINTLMTPPRVFTYAVSVMLPGTEKPEVQIQTLKLVSAIQLPASNQVVR
jgi:prepilin-type N-terminal cleavage/methylation domain-containing protein